MSEALPGATPIPAVEARLLGAFVDVLVPGDDLFPAASEAGAHGLLAERLRQQHGPDAFDRVGAALAAASGGRSLTQLPNEERVVAVERLEREEPALFDILRTILYYSYYGSPLVVRAIRDLGHDYNDAPQPRGYRMAPFDPTPGLNAPAIPRGNYQRTDEVARVDLRGVPGLRPAEEA